jgi:Flp pilus assembly protein TadD
MQQAFGMSASEFDKALRNYVSAGRYRYYPIPNPVTISPNSYTATPLKAADGNAMLADIHLHSPDYQDRALDEFQEILKTDPNNAAACRGLGYGYLQKQDFSHASEYFQRASQMDSKDPRVHYYSALLMARESSFSSSADLPTMTKELETSITLDPTFADSYALLAFAQSTAGDSAKALAAMQKAVAMSPRNEEYRFNLADLYMANREPEQAIALLHSLQGSSNPALAARASATLAQVQQFEQAMLAGTPDGRLMRRGATEPDVSTPASVPLVNSGPAKFLKGVLTNIDCATPPAVVLTVVSGNKSWVMKAADRNHLVLIGADEFSCSWHKQKVAVNYRETAPGEGAVISLEIQ